MDGAATIPGEVDTLVIGGGQSGIAMSEHLTRRGVPHLVLERARIAEAWRSGRWDSLVANGPAWHDRFPGAEFEGIDGDAFAGKEAVADYLAAYARRFDAPIRTGVDVTRLGRDGDGFRAETSAGPVRARRVVVATGPFQKPLIPAVVPEEAGLVQIHSAAYRNPGQLPPGAVLVVGAGSSGAQIADELNKAGRRVFLSVGPHDRPPRRYRGRDFVWWLGALGHWDAKTRGPGTEHVTIAVSGAGGGRTVDFRRLAAEGITLVGRVEGWDGSGLTVRGDLQANVARGDAHYLSVLDEADAHVAAHGLDLPEEPGARDLLPDPACLTDPIRRIDPKAEGIASIVWATGYALDFGWIDLPAFDAEGRPRHERGVSVVPGLHFLGLPWLSRRASAFIWGCWTDAAYLADHIAAHQETPA